jgi:flap endonuclease-1
MGAHMGVQIRGLVPRKKIQLPSLNGRTIAIDAHNALYQFLSIIRSYDGRPLMDKAGNVTSHLSGLLYRTANFIEYGMKPMYVFDGPPPPLKKKTIARRRDAKIKARKRYAAAIKEGKLEDAKRYAQATAQLTASMVQDAQRLLTLMGIPWMQAPSEGEAQIAYMAAKGKVWAAASQDYDALLFGASRLLRNVAITGRRKLPRKQVYIEVEPELVELQNVLRELEITREQLVIIGILVGTDFNPDGIKGIGPKRALALVKKFKTLPNVIKQFDPSLFPVDPIEINDLFLQPPIQSDIELTWTQPNTNEIVSFLCVERDFSESRVQGAIEKMQTTFHAQKTKPTLDTWF